MGLPGTIFLKTRLSVAIAKTPACFLRSKWMFSKQAKKKTKEKMQQFVK